MKDDLRRLLRQPAFDIGLVIVLFWVACAIFGPSVVPHDPYADDLINTLMPPSSEHWFGTDQLGRDVFSRVIVGARDILTVAPLATLISTILGTALGLTMGYFGGWVDEVLGRIVDAMLAVIAFSFAPIMARTVRSAVLAERSLDYVAAAELRRENTFYILFMEILPNVLPPILVETTVRLGYAIFTVATLSFIGFGIQPPSPDWGLSISSNYGMIGGGFWWTVVFDSLAIASLVIGINLVADGIEGLRHD